MGCEGNKCEQRVWVWSGVDTQEWGTVKAKVLVTGAKWRGQAYQDTNSLNFSGPPKGSPSLLRKRRTTVRSIFPVAVGSNSSQTCSNVWRRRWVWG